MVAAPMLKRRGIMVHDRGGNDAGGAITDKFGVVGNAVASSLDWCTITNDTNSSSSGGGGGGGGGRRRRRSGFGFGFDHLNLKAVLGSSGGGDGIDDDSSGSGGGGGKSGKGGKKATWDAVLFWNKSGGK